MGTVESKREQDLDTLAKVREELERFALISEDAGAIRAIAARIALPEPPREGGEPGAVQWLRDRCRRQCDAHFISAEGEKILAYIDQLRAERGQAEREARDARMLVAPAQDHSGVHDKTKSDEWNAGYRQRQREQWSRALNAERANTALRAERDSWKILAERANDARDQAVADARAIQDECMKHTAQRGHSQLCPVCDGTGVIDQGPVFGSCQKCGGSGSIERATAQRGDGGLRDELLLEAFEEGVAVVAADSDGDCVAVTSLYDKAHVRSWWEGSAMFHRLAAERAALAAPQPPSDLRSVAESLGFGDDVRRLERDVATLSQSLREGRLWDALEAIKRLTRLPIDARDLFGRVQDCYRVADDALRTALAEHPPTGDPPAPSPWRPIEGSPYVGGSDYTLWRIDLTSKGESIPLRDPRGQIALWPTREAARKHIAQDVRDLVEVAVQLRIVETPPPAAGQEGRS